MRAASKGETRGAAWVGAGPGGGRGPGTKGSSSLRAQACKMTKRVRYATPGEKPGRGRGARCHQGANVLGAGVARATPTGANAHGWRASLQSHSENRQVRGRWIGPAAAECRGGRRAALLRLAAGPSSGPRDRWFECELSVGCSRTLAPASSRASAARPRQRRSDPLCARSAVTVHDDMQPGRSHQRPACCGC